MSIIVYDWHTLLFTTQRVGAGSDHTIKGKIQQQQDCVSKAIKLNKPQITYTLVYTDYSNYRLLPTKIFRNRLTALKWHQDIEQVQTDATGPAHSALQPGFQACTALHPANTHAPT